MKRLQQEEKAMQNYIKKKEMYDLLDEEKRKRNLKNKEMETKRILDIQMQTRLEEQRVKKFSDVVDAEFMHKDIKDFTEVERKKYDEMMEKNKQ
jgi:hypothetical protein